MSLDFRNTNTLWASILVETLHRLGLTTAVICPGSRSGPLAIAFAQHPQIEAIPVLDERSAAFFALGVARRSGLPVALVCTSGTAAANFYPAVIEARESHVPLLVLTADRPPEIRHCHAGQAIDQTKLYGHYPQWQAELAVPEVETGMLDYLRQTILHAWERTQFPTAGPVHLNLPLRDPLAPVPQPNVQALEADFDQEGFFVAVHSQTQALIPSSGPGWSIPWQEWLNCERGVIIAGPAQPGHAERYCQAIADLAVHLGWPVLAEGLSPLRNYADRNPHLITSYDLLLRQPDFAQKLQPEMVIQLGELPTSKPLRSWLQEAQPRTWIVELTADNLDPLHGKTTALHGSVEWLVLSLDLSEPEVNCSDYCKQWLEAEIRVRQLIQTTFQAVAWLLEPKLAWLLSQTLPAETPLFIASSMPVRDVEAFWQPGTSRITPYFNRGANGIDGTLSTALGISHRQQASVCLTGDLALLHDTNGFLLRNFWQGHLTIVLINNNGGGIFEMLPIARFEPPFETFFATPQQIDFAQLCATYGVDHELIQSWEQLQQRLNPLPRSGIRVLEIHSDRRRDAQWRQAMVSVSPLGTFHEGAATPGEYRS